MIQQVHQWWGVIPADNYLFKFNSGNTKIMCEICSKLILKTPARRQWRLSGVFVVWFGQVTYSVLELFFAFSLSGFHSRTLAKMGQQGNGGTIFFPLYSFHPLYILKIFICNFASVFPSIRAGPQISVSLYKLRTVYTQNRNKHSPLISTSLE